MSFNEELFGCFNDWISCVVAFCTPCGDACLTAHAVQKSTNEPCMVPCILHCCLSCIGGALNNTKVRKQMGYEGSCFIDCLLFCCCGPCASSRVYREVMKSSS